MARKKERESKSALTERNTLIEEEKKLVELKAFVAKRALILKGLISKYPSKCSLKAKLFSLQAITVGHSLRASQWFTTPFTTSVGPSRVLLKSEKDFLENSISEKYKNRPVNIQGCRISS